MSPTCMNCGEKVEESWTRCPMCNRVLKEAYEMQQSQNEFKFQNQIPDASYYSKPSQQPFQRPPQHLLQLDKSYSKKSSDKSSALILAIIGCFCFGVIFGTLAIIVGIVELRENNDNSRATIGVILGVIEIFCFIAQIMLLLSLLSSISSY